MSPALVVAVGLALVVAAAFVGGPLWFAALTMALVGAGLVLVGVLAAEPWKGGRDGKVG